MIGQRRSIDVNGKTYYVFQLPCSDRIEIKHPDKRYLVCMTPGKSNIYDILNYFNSYREAEDFLISTISRTESKHVSKIDLTKDIWRNSKLFSRTNSLKTDYSDTI